MVSVIACVIILASFGTFSFFNKFLEFEVIPIPKRYVGNLQYKWRGTVVSLVHTSIVCFMSMFSVPTIWSDFVLNYTSIGETTVAIFTGYTIYDTIKLLRNVNSNVVASLILHHVMFTASITSILRSNMGTTVSSNSKKPSKVTYEPVNKQTKLY
ncbi:uncharacterized protein [Amphiura filiformis]|uniref:uncharacterized protein n=1 Tax=Amphiura filiformis TaxID=82378 RepID=UPI003B227018